MLRGGRDPALVNGVISPKSDQSGGVGLDPCGSKGIRCEEESLVEECSPKHRLGAVRGLDLRLLVDTDHHRTAGRDEMQASGECYPTLPVIVFAGIRHAGSLNEQPAQPLEGR